MEGVRGAEIAPHGDVREVTNVVDKPPEAGIIEWPVLRHSRSVAHCLLDRAKPNLRVCYYGGACRVTRRTQPQCGIRCREFAEYRSAAQTFALSCLPTWHKRGETKVPS